MVKRVTSRFFAGSKQSKRSCEGVVFIEGAIVLPVLLFLVLLVAEAASALNIYFLLTGTVREAAITASNLQIADTRSGLVAEAPEEATYAACILEPLSSGDCAQTIIAWRISHILDSDQVREHIAVSGTSPSYLIQPETNATRVTIYATYLTFFTKIFGLEIPMKVSAVGGVLT